MKAIIEKCEGVNKCWYNGLIGQIFEVVDIEPSGLSKTKIFVKINAEHRRHSKDRRSYAAVYKNDVKIINE